MQDRGGRDGRCLFPLARRDGVGTHRHLRLCGGVRRRLEGLSEVPRRLEVALVEGSDDFFRGPVGFKVVQAEVEGCEPALEDELVDLSGKGGGTLAGAGRGGGWVERTVGLEYSWTEEA